MIARRVVPQFCFAITMTGRDFGSGREEDLIGESLGLERGTAPSPLFFSTWWHGACMHTFVHLHSTCTPSAPRPSIVYPNVRAEYLGQCCKKAKKIEEERKPTELTESNLPWQVAIDNIMITLGCFPWQTHYLLQ
jgi:hypothetical protein